MCTQRFSGGVADIPGDQTLFTLSAAADHDHGVAYTRVRPQAGFYFTEFDPETADLDLIIVTAQIIDATIGVPAAQIAGAVHACVRLG